MFGILIVLGTILLGFYSTYNELSGQEREREREREREEISKVFLRSSSHRNLLGGQSGNSFGDYPILVLVYETWTKLRKKERKG